MAAAGAKLDAYAHHPYPEDPHDESPTSGGCGHCRSITMATLDRLARATHAAWGPDPALADRVRVPDEPAGPALGVSLGEAGAVHGRGGAARLTAPRVVDMLIHFMFRDDPSPAGWQSGFFTKRGVAKPAAQAFPLPLAQVSPERPVDAACGARCARTRASARTGCSGTVGGRWQWLGTTHRTNERGFFYRRVSRGGRGARLRPLVGARRQVRLRARRALTAFARRLAGERVFW